MKKLLICSVAAAAMLFASCATSNAVEEKAEETPAVPTTEVETAEEEAPATEEEAPATEEEAPATEEEAPATEEEAPATEEEAPAAEEEAPAAEEEAPAVTGFAGNWATSEVLIDGAAVTGAEATLNIEGPVYAIAGNAGVNNYFGNVIIDGNTFKANTDEMSSVASTLMIGPAEEQDFEDAYMAALMNADKIELEDDALVISSEHSRIAYKKADAAEAVTADFAGSWEVSEVVINNTTITGATATLNIAPMYNISGNAGINNYFGNIAVKGNDFGFDKESFDSSAFGLTKMAGPEEAMDFEDAYMTAFLKSSSIALEGDSLVISGENFKIVYNKAE